MFKTGVCVRQVGQWQIWVAIHRYSGLAMMLFLGVAAATGCALCFEKPLDAGLNPSLFRPAAPGAIDPLLAVTRLERARPDLRATYFPVRAVPGENIKVAVEPRRRSPLGYDELFLDGGDGHVAGTRDARPGWDRPHFMRAVYLIHSTLLAGDAGRWLMGVTALAWLISNLIGIYVTWPLKRPYWRQWTRMWAFRPSSPLPRLMLDGHRSTGLWLAVPLTILAFTSVALNFYGEAFTPIVQYVSPPAPSPFDGPPIADPDRFPTRLGFADIRAPAEAIARRRAPGWRAAVFQREADRHLMGLRFTRSGIEEYRGLGPVTYWFDDRDGRFVHADDPYRGSAGLALGRSLFPLHTGLMIGGIGVALDFLLGLAVLVLSGTGIYLWLKRRRQRVAARRRGRAKPAIA